ncbi:MAG TPA: hypothetical protein VK654_02835 [Nitrospirota bacterium]|nr:hypothetical protein [Nitrospirota bacterium]
MKKKMVSLLAAVFLVSGCASMFMKGGTLVKDGYKPKRVVVAYKAVGTVPPNVEYQLVETDKGMAIFERSADGSGTLFETHWKDEQGDHYAGWVATSHGFEFVVPADLKKEAKRYVYPKGYYSLKTINDVERPVPVVKLDPVAKLIPK